MAARAPFLTQPYGAYYHRDVPDEDVQEAIQADIANFTAALAGANVEEVSRAQGSPAEGGRQSIEM